jgi:hypothetical protein
MREVVIDYGADTITVQWQAAIARLLGRGSDTLSLKGVCERALRLHSATWQGLPVHPL